MRQEGRAEITLSKAEWLLGFAIAEFGSKPDSKITSALVLESLRKVEQRGHHGTTQRMRSTIPDAIERALAHVENNSVRRAYARGAHWDERVKMAEWWADYLDELRSSRA